MKTTLQRKIFQGFNTVFMLFIAFICLYPMLHIVIASFSDPAMVVAHKGLLYKPLGFNIGAYQYIFSNNIILNGYKNTLFILVVGTSLNLLLTILAAYVLSSKDVYWAPFIMMGIVFTMYFQGGLIPTYLNIKRLGLYDSIWSVIIPVAVNSFNLIIMRTSFKGIPDSLLESAELDGAGDFTKLFRIVVPLSGSVIAVMVLYYGVQHWNSWFNASLYIRDKEMQPLQVILREILILNETSSVSGGDNALFLGENIKYATIVVVMTPILVVYPALQKYFAKGVMIGAIKG